VKVDGDDVLGFHVVKLGEDQLECLLSVRDPSVATWLGHGCGRARDACPRDW
jgi:hypothetical protein